MANPTAFKGPLIVYGNRAPLGNSNENPSLAPSLMYAGTGFFDNRAGYNVTKPGAIGLGGGESAVINQVPSAISAVNIAAAQTPTAGTKLTLVSSSGAGITVLATATRVWASGNVIPIGALAIDIVPTLISFGTNDEAGAYTPISFYDPTKTIARAVRISSVGSDSGATATIVGYDLYGYPQTQTVTLTNGSVVTTTKTFKFITSITPNGTLSGSNISVGTADVYGIPMLSSFWGDVNIVWNNSWINTNTGYVAADTTSPATALTGDVRGTYATQSASDGTKRLMVFVCTSANNLALGNTGIFGVNPA